MRSRGLWAQTVTVYHPIPEKKRVVRTVLHGTVCQLGQRAVPDAAGAKAGAAMLLVLPGETTGTIYRDEAGQESAVGTAVTNGPQKLRYGADYRVTSGDRVLLGEGPAVAWADWPQFVPAEVDGMGVLTYVLPLYLHGELHHVEAGAWWSSGGAGAGRLAR